MMSKLGGTVLGGVVGAVSLALFGEYLEADTLKEFLQAAEGTDGLHAGFATHLPHYGEGLSIAAEHSELVQKFVESTAQVADGVDGAGFEGSLPAFNELPEPAREALEANAEAKAAYIDLQENYAAKLAEIIPDMATEAGQAPYTNELIGTGAGIATGGVIGRLAAGRGEQAQEHAQAKGFQAMIEAQRAAQGAKQLV